MRRKLIFLGVVVAASFAVWLLMMRGEPHSGRMSGGAADSAAGGAIVAVKMPELSGDAALGALAFKGKCAACHGDDAGGVHGKGPPLVHKTYNPGHHGDQAFFMAAKNGARQHHWPFGDMPPVTGITDADIKMILAYVRAVQKANGIF